MKNTFTHFLTYFIAIPLSAQPSIQWQKCLGGNGPEDATEIQLTNDGGYVLTGKTLSNTGDVSGNNGGTDYWIVKLDSSGTTQWQKTLGGTNNDWGYSIQQTTDSGYIVAGFTESNNVDVSGNHGDKDGWVVKLGSTGDIQWQKCLGGSSWDEFWCIRQTSDKGYILVGRSNSLDGDVTGNHGYMDLWIVKLNQDGILEWQSSLGGSSADIGYSVQQTAEGGYIVIGETSSNDGNITGFHGSTDFWVIKLNHSGIIEWQKALGTNSLDRGNDIFPTNDGGYIVVGEVSANNGDVTGYHGGYDFWVVKLTGTGIIEWQKALGGSSEEFARSVKQTNDGGYIIAGATQSNNGDVIGNDGGLDFWVVKLTTEGSIQWQKTLGGIQGDWGNYVQQTIDGGYVVAGYTVSNNGDVSGNHGSQDFWVVKLSPSSTPTASPHPAPLAIYPNPAHQLITVQLPDSFSTKTWDVFPMTIRVTDLPGREVMRQTIVSEAPLNIEAIPNGLYLLTATSNSGKVFSGKFVKQE